MRAIDANVVVRLIARDDLEAEAVARDLLDEPFLLIPTVLLESEWVLRSVYRLSRQIIDQGFRLLLGHENASVLNGAALAWALDRYAEGGDFADMLHLALAREAEAEFFATFDREVKKAAGDAAAFVQCLRADA